MTLMVLARITKYQTPKINYHEIFGYPIFQGRLQYTEFTTIMYLHKA